MGHSATSGVIDHDGGNSDPGVPIGDLDKDTIIEPGVHFGVVGLGPHNFFGRIVNYGIVLVSQVLATEDTYPGLTADYIEGEFYQYGEEAKLMINDVQGKTGAHYKWNLTTFVNQGQMAYCGNGADSDTFFGLDYKDYFSNEGAMSIEQTDKQAKVIAKFRNTNNEYLSMSNYGTIRGVNARLDFPPTLQGNGCIFLNNSILHVNDEAAEAQQKYNSSILVGQSAHLYNEGSGLTFSSGLFTANRNLGLMISGFGKGKTIDVGERVTRLKYENDQLVAIVRSQRAGIIFHIGSGYDASKFKRSGSIITYTDDAPASQAQPPAQCVVEDAVCGELPRTADELKKYLLGQ